MPHPYRRNHPPRRRAEAPPAAAAWPRRLLLGALVLLGPGAAQAVVEVRVSDSDPPLVELRAERTRLTEVLTALAEAADFDLVVDGDLGERVGTWRFRDRPLAAVLESLARGLGLTVFYADGLLRRGEIIEVHIHAPAAAAAGAARSAAAPRGTPHVATPAAAEGPRSLAGQADFSDPANRGLLIAYMRDDPDAGVRREAIDLLAGNASDAAADWGAQCLSDVDGGVRRHCVNVLANLRPPGLVALLGETIYGEAEAQVRAAAISALARQPDDQAGALLDALSKDPGLGMEQEAERALRQWESATARRNPEAVASESEPRPEGAEAEGQPGAVAQ